MKHECDNCKYRFFPAISSPCDNCLRSGDEYSEWTAQTNADRIRSMNNKDLARILEGTSYPWCNTPINCHHNNCYDCCEEWLKKEVKE